MAQSNCQSHPWHSEVEDIKIHLVEIDRAVKSIERHQVQIRCLIDKISGANSQSITFSPIFRSESNENVEDHQLASSNPKQTWRNPDLNHHGQFCPHPSCRKGPLDEKPLRRHYATHVYCSDVSNEDIQCICCAEPLDKVSTFKKNHASCLERMKDKLPRDIIAKAVKQRDRIIEAPAKLLDAAFRQAGNEAAKNPRKRVQNSECEEFSPPPPKISRSDGPNVGSTLHAPQVNTGNETSPLVAIFDSANLPEASPVPNLNFPPPETSPQTGSSSNYVGTFPLSAGLGRGSGSEVYDLHQSTTDGYDVMLYNRSSAMVVNPMDGLIWDLSKDMRGHTVH